MGHCSKHGHFNEDCWPCWGEERDQLRTERETDKATIEAMIEWMGRIAIAVGKQDCDSEEIAGEVERVAALEGGSDG